MSPNETVPLIAAIPFVILLLSIAILPLLIPRFWEKNLNKGIATFIISLPCLIFLLLAYQSELFHNMRDYASFIIMLASLFIISGGILVTGDLKGTPGVNTLFLIVGAVLANFIGTTGASMILIRPLLKTNSERHFTKHIPLFFIFVVANIGGCLTPLGDPPLFLGYLRGVPFTWTLGLIPEWLVALGIVISIFFVWDSISYKRETVKDIALDKSHITPLGLQGKINIIFILGIVAAVFFQIHTPFREFIMIAMIVLSLIFTKKQTRAENGFTFYPIVEVAILFAGIFVTMVPLLMMLRSHGAELGITKPWQFFWLTGGLSSFLDNAPTYLTFFSLAQSVTANLGLSDIQMIAGVKTDLLRAISCGAVFMGANTYIGNGPNFMIKSIAEEQGAHVPHFFEYMLYAGLILVPVFIIITLIFFR